MEQAETKSYHVSDQQFVEFLESRKGTTILSFTSVVELQGGKRIKKVNPWGDIEKVSNVVGMVGYDYEHSVQLQQNREGQAPADFVAENRQWGTRVSKKFVEHKGEIYVTLKIERAVDKPIYRKKDGTVLDSREVFPYLYAKKEGERQPVDDKVIHREYKLKSLTSVMIGGVRYMIEHNSDPIEVKGFDGIKTVIANAPEVKQEA